MERGATVASATVSAFPGSRVRSRAGLVLTGGGARAAYQVGVVKAVRDVLGAPKKSPFPILCGTFGTHALHLQYVDQVIGLRPGVRNYAAMNALMLPARTVFICDTYVTPDPDAEQIADMTLLAAEEMRRFGLAPKVALLSASNFGSVPTPSSRKMQRALQMIAERAPDLEADGEMHGDAALSEEIRLKVFPRSKLRGEANLLIMPDMDAANIAFNLLKTAAGGGVTIGPMLLGAARAVHILTPSATVRRIVNMTALAVADANAPRGQEQTLF